MATVTNKGLEAQARMLAGVIAPAAFTYIALGDNTNLTPEDPSNTALDTELGAYGAQRAAATCEFLPPDTTRWSHTFYFTAVRAINEIGIFNTMFASADMFMRHVLPSQLNYNDGDSIEVIITNTTQRL